MSQPTRNALRCGQAGQALVLVALSLTTLMAAAGLAIDMGYLRSQRRQMQLAADSAALAGAAEINNGNSVAAAQNSAQLNGFSTASVSVSQITIPSGQSGIQVQVQQNLPTFFMRIFGVSTISVGATGVAYLGNSTGCIYALQAGGSGIDVTGTVTAPTCGIIDNGDLSGNGSLNVSYIGYAGSNAGYTGTYAVNPQSIAATPTADPLFFLQAMTPALGGCLPAGSGQVGGATSATLLPGNYCGGININTTGTVTFGGGVYTITGGNFAISAGNVSSAGGLTFYLNGTNQVQITGGNISLSAPTSGTYAGILFFQDPADTQAATVGGAATSLAGALYFPDASLSIGAPGSTAPYTIVVAQTISSLSDIILGSNYSSLANGSPITAALLVE